MKAIPAIFFPSQILLVDDDPNVIEILKQQLDNNKIKILTALNANEALNEFNINNVNTPELADIITDSFQDDLYNDNTSIVKFDISKLLNEFENYSKYSFISVIISDQNMPGESGLELFKRLKNSLCKKILLTGQITDRKVIEAFNWGIINRYAEKEDQNLILTLNKYIEELTYEYFLNISTNIHLTNTQFSILFEPAFIELFNEIIKEFNIIRFCLIDRSGSFLMIDNSNCRYVMAISTDDDIEEIMESDTIPAKHLLDLKNRNVIPFFGIGINSTMCAIKNWEEYLFPAKCINAKKRYFWSFISV